MSESNRREEPDTTVLNQQPATGGPEHSTEGQDEQDTLSSAFEDTGNKDIFLRLAVSFYLSMGLSQKDIALILCRSESVVSRAVSDAKQKRWLKVSYDINGIPLRYRRLLPLCLSVPSLREKLLNKFPQIENCTVVPGPNFFQKELGRSDHAVPYASASQEGELHALLAKAAAERLVTIISSFPCQTILIGWGYTINRLLENTHFPERKRPDQKGSSFESLQILPILGNFSIGHAPGSNKNLDDNEAKKAYEIFIRYSANANARILSMRCGQSLPPKPLLTVALLDAGPEELELCKPVFLADHALMELYGKFWDPEDRSGKIWEADTLVTSIGTSAYPEDFVYRALGYDVAGREAKFSGDISGVLFDEDGKPIKVDKGQLVGLRLDHILHIAKRHRQLCYEGEKLKGAGVVVVAAGEEKVSPLFSLAQNGFINELITTERTAEMLLSH
jgi:DNA-binding transcriptional regulator LsrR (DeoR family)